ncbi:hypothetical protein [Streptomyces tritici]|uniref:hypothetical protein n=1 Tax=Streptomyces tritici TaxID=2054410 RepID=UPI003AEF49A9
MELDSRDVSDDAMDGLHENLAEASPAVGTAPNGNFSVWIFVDTATARQADEAALKAVTAAAPAQGITAPLVGFEVLMEDELDRRNDEPTGPALVGTARSPRCSASSVSARASSATTSRRPSPR